MRSMVFLALVATAILLPAASAMAQAPADQATIEQLKSRLRDSGQLRNYRIEIKYQDGVAWLDGTVTSAVQRDAAVRLAEGTSGVSHVVCRLEIVGGSAPGRTNMSAAFGDTEKDATAGPTSKVVQAAAVSRPRSSPRQTIANGQRLPATAPNNAISAAQRPMTRGNMPLPAGRMAAYPAAAGAGTGAGGQGVNQAYQGPPSDPGMSGMYAGSPSMAPAPTAFVPGGSHGVNYDNAQMPGYAWPSYASYPNYAALTYPQQYSPTAWPYIGPFYPYPQVPLAWRRVSLEWDDGWWFLDFSAHNSSH